MFNYYNFSTIYILTIFKFFDFGDYTINYYFGLNNTLNS